jgi:V8-like Glu-specific endopeptidase
MSSRRTLPLASLALLAAACAPDAGPAATTTPLETTQQAAVYGEDDRRDYFESDNDLWRARTAQSIVAMMETGDLDIASDGTVQIDGDTFGPTYGLCRDERFYDQINAADCSATLIDDDLVLTAGHCVQSNSACQRQRWVFRFFMESETELASIVEEDIYRCSQLVVQELSESRSGRLDYAILQLDRPATPRFEPAPVARNVAMTVGEPVTIIGFGSGLPAKIDDGGKVTEARTNTLDYFEATTDSFGGNSGSGVFNARGEVVGILVNGQNDYTYRGGCARPQEYPETGSPNGAEGITYAERAIIELCEGGWQSTRLCGTSSVCGDGICSPGEEAGCAEDCEGNIPGWTCDPGNFGAGDGCDCECGAFDPDCADPGQTVLNCEVGNICDATGECVSETTPPDPDPEPDTVPAAWTCDPELYDAADGCDCECGAYDPDCADPDADIYNCTAEQLCGDDGLCVDPDDIEDPGTPNEEVPSEDGFGEVIFGDSTSPAGCAAGGAPLAAGFVPMLLAVLRRRRRS